MNLQKVAEVHSLLSILSHPVMFCYVDENGNGGTREVNRIFLDWDGNVPRAIKNAKKMDLVRTWKRHYHFGRPALHITLSDLGAKITRKHASESE